MLAVEDLLRDNAFVNGHWVSADSGNRFEVTNPADGATLTSVPDLSPADVVEAIDAAREAFKPWKQKTAGHRAKILSRWHDLILANEKDLALLMTLEQGKPMRESRGEIRYAASFVRWFAEEARRTYGDVIPPHMADKRILALKQPVGVVAAITPWNFPAAMITRKVAPALAAGCTVVVKPSEWTPLTALALARLAEDAGFPSGVLNVVTTMDAAGVGATLTSHPDVRKISFTGSTRVGKLLLAGAADTVKRVSLELGGNAPFIVFDDADLEAAVEGAVASKYRNAGQTCICANRILVQEGIAEEFTVRLTAKTSRLTVGPGVDDSSQIGPLINESALEKVTRLISSAQGAGATVRTGGNAHELGSTFFEPTLLSGVTDEMDIFSEEIFGPVSAISTFKTEEEVIRRANDTPFGLAAYVFTRDYARAWRVPEALEYGMVGVNTGMISSPVAPFGGVKQSGIGREGSRYGMDEFLETKTVTIGGL
ncbi:MAG: NAD-dependent succinate-semialdehyde dehydrogenase [Rhodothermales bacterium]